MTHPARGVPLLFFWRDSSLDKNKNNLPHSPKNLLLRKLKVQPDGLGIQYIYSDPNYNRTVSISTLDPKSPYISGQSGI